MSNFFSSFFNTRRNVSAASSSAEQPTAREILQYSNRCLDTYKELMDVNKQIARDLKENTRLLMSAMPSINPQQIRTCSNGHELAQYTALGGTCDVCRRIVFVGEQVMDCRTCNWYMCAQCSQRNGFSPLQPPLNLTSLLLNNRQEAGVSTEVFSMNIPLDGRGFDSFISQLETALGQFSSQPEDVVVTPTDAQIANACVVMTGRDANLPDQYVCPIDLSPVSPDDNVMVIKHCKHAFRESNLRELFTRDVKCPMCRFDIRDYVEEESNDCYWSCDGTCSPDRGCPCVPCHEPDLD
jgi:hypothetical protein